MTADPYAFASQAAEQIVKGMGITALPIDPRAIAEKREIVVQAKSVDDKGCSGMLVRLGNDFAIAYATHLQNEGFENFSVAHELGHYFMPGHVEAVIQGETGMHLSRAGFNSGNRYEAEADRFAAGLLMPRHLFFPAIDRAGKDSRPLKLWQPYARHPFMLPLSDTHNVVAIPSPSSSVAAGSSITASCPKR